MSDRDQFREAVLKRDGYACLICGRGSPLDAHHILERRLWDDGGYHIENGATLCDGRLEGDKWYAGCHMLAEQTSITPDQLRTAARIKNVILPAHFYNDQNYDKWGNICLPNGTRLKGELFGDESVQKVLAAGRVLDQFIPYVKYPRTPHFLWSEAITDADRVMESMDVFRGRRVIVTEKMDGENTTMYADYIHARSLDGSSHRSRAWVKKIQAEIGYQLCNFRVCGENLFAEHTLHYENLPSYFLMFSIWDNGRNECLAWDDTVLYGGVLGLKMVPVLYDGEWDEKLIRGLAAKMDLTKQEGYVVRLAESFTLAAFRHSVGKFVRAAHVGTSHNWMMKRVVQNELA
jgi:hypothetical protein